MVITHEAAHQILDFLKDTGRDEWSDDYRAEFITWIHADAERTWTWRHVAREMGIVAALIDVGLSEDKVPVPGSALYAELTGTPMLLLTRTTSSADCRPFEFVRSLYRGDRYRFVTTLHSPSPSPETEDG